MSALPPKADIGTQSRNVRFVPKADSCTAANGASSFNQLIGAVEQLRRDGQTKRFCGLQVDDQLEFCRLLNWQIRRTSAPKNLINVGRCPPPRFAGVVPIREQS